MQWYSFIAMRTLVRTEGLLTQLVFEHSLRIRLNAEASNEDNVTVVGTPDNASVAEGKAIDLNSDERASEPSQASTVLSRDSSIDSQSTSTLGVEGGNKDDSSPIKTNAKQAIKSKKGAQNLIGKINNLVTTDLGNIVQAREFLLISELQSCRISLELLADTPASLICPTSNGPVHHVLVSSTRMEVALSSYSGLKE